MTNKSIFRYIGFCILLLAVVIGHAMTVAAKIPLWCFVCLPRIWWSN